MGDVKVCRGVMSSTRPVGDVPIIRQSLEEVNDVTLNLNCVDYMGRSALHLDRTTHRTTPDWQAHL